MKNISKTLFITLFFSLLGSYLFASDVLVYRNESMPWCGTVDGKDAGITVDILNAVTKNGGPKFKFKSVPWKRAQVNVQKNKGTAIIPFTRTPTREKNHTWIAMLVPNQVRFTMAKNPIKKISLPSPLTLDNAKDLKIGIIRGHALIPTLKALGFKKIHEVNKADQLVKMLQKGRIPVMADSKWVDSYLWKQIGQKPEDLIAGPNVGETKYIYLGAALNFPPEITKQIRDVMSKMRESGEVDRILDKWVR